MQALLAVFPRHEQETTSRKALARNGAIAQLAKSASGL
jgi:hypothetical protein